MSETLIEGLTKTKEGMRLYQQERAIQDLTDLVGEVMEEEGVCRTELARRIGKTKGYITQLLDGRTNMTIRTISDVFTVLNRAIHFQDGPLDATVRATPMLTYNLKSEWVANGDTWSQSDVVTRGSRPVPEKLAV